MTRPEAARILEIPADATPDQIEARFHERRTKLEEKVGKAPTPGLKAKYRESLNEITSAFETLTLAADSSSLPVLKKEAGDGRPEAGGPASLRAAGDGGAASSPRDPDSGFRSQVSGLPPPKKAKSGGREFTLVAIIAVAVLGAGGWFVMKTRAENAEQARMAAEAKAKADRLAEEKRLAAEAEQARRAEERRLAEEEKVHLAAAEKAEQERLEQVGTRVRVQLAEAKIAWEVIQRELRNAEQTLAEIKSEERLLRDAKEGQRRELAARVAAQAAFTQWLSSLLPAHPARLALARIEELLNARQYDQVATEFPALKTTLEGLPAEIQDRREREFEISGTVRIESSPSDLPWTMTDAFGQTFQGTTPATMDRVAPGPAQLSITRSGWPVPQTSVVEVRRRESVTRRLEFKPAQVVLESQPAGAVVTREGQDGPLGTTPLNLAEQIPGPARYRFSLKGHHIAEENVELQPGGSHRIAATLRSIPWPQEGQDWTLPDLELQLIWVAPGEFLMGAPETEAIRPSTKIERPQTRVILTHGYWLGKFEVSVAQWVALMGEPTRLNRGNPAGSPAYGISWEQATDFCLRLSERERRAGRLPPNYFYALPTEAQWEYACRAGTTGPFPGDPERLVPKGLPTARGTKEANPWGFHDMHSSVYEWCRDAFNLYPGGSVRDPLQTVPIRGTLRVLRGGSWLHDSKVYIRSASRGAFEEKYSLSVNSPGLRVALVRQDN